MGSKTNNSTLWLKPRILAKNLSEELFTITNNIPNIIRC